MSILETRLATLKRQNARARATIVRAGSANRTNAAHLSRAIATQVSTDNAIAVVQSRIEEVKAQQPA